MTLLQICIVCLLRPIFLAISSFFLLLAFVVLIILADLRKQIFGQVLPVFVAAIFASNLVQSVTSFGGQDLAEDVVGCKVLAFAAQVQVVLSI